MNNKYIIILFLAIVIFVGTIFFFRKHSVNTSPMPLPAVEPTSSADISEGLSLFVYEPSNHQTITSSSVMVRGKTRPDAEVFVNDLQTKAAADGMFSVNVEIDPGDNDIYITANDDQGNYAEKDLTVVSQVSTDGGL